MWVRHLEASFHALAVAAGMVRDYRFSKQAVDAIKPIVPYVLHPVTNGESSPRIWLNRWYKPLGVADGLSVRYEDFTSLHVEGDSKILDYFATTHRKRFLFSDAPPAYYLFLDHTAPRLGKAHAKRVLDTIGRVVADERARRG